MEREFFSSSFIIYRIELTNFSSRIYCSKRLSWNNFRFIFFMCINLMLLTFHLNGYHHLFVSRVYLLYQKVYKVRTFFSVRTQINPFSFWFVHKLTRVQRHVTVLVKSKAIILDIVQLIRAMLQFIKRSQFLTISGQK